MHVASAFEKRRSRAMHERQNWNEERASIQAAPGAAMLPMRQRIPAHLRFRGVAYLVLLITFVPAFLIYWRVANNVETRDAARFARAADGVRQSVNDSFEALTGDLRALAAFFEAKGTVAPVEWEKFLAMLQFEHRHPGVRSIGFAQKVTPAQRAAFLRTMRSRVNAEYDLFPASSQPLNFPTVYVKQFPTNVVSRLGWDCYSDPARRVVLDGIMAKGEIGVTGKANYWNKDAPDSVGFTIFVPVHADGELQGVVFSSFIPQQLLNALGRTHFDNDVQVEFFDGSTAEPQFLLGSTAPISDAQPGSPSRIVPVRVVNRPVLLRVAALPSFAESSYQHLPAMALAGGLFLSLLLFRITWRQLDARARAEELNSRLRSSEEQLRAANEELEARIAQAHATEGLLAHERDLLRMLLDHAPDRIYFKDRDSRFIKCGHALIQRLGLEPTTDCTGRTDRDFFAEEHAAAARAIEQQIIRTGQPVVGLVEKETWIDGKVTWVLTSKMALRDNGGKIIGTFGISKDITALKAAEIELQREKELLAVTLRSIADGVITTDTDGKIVLFNQVAEQVTGWTQAEAAGQPVENVFRVLRSSAGSEPTVTEGAAPLPDDHDLLVTRNGENKSIAQSMAAIVDRDGNRHGTVVVFRDVTEKLKTDAELLKASKLESIGVLAGGIAHDFNNILTVILGNISLARLAGTQGRSTTGVLAEAEKASLRARELTHRLLTFAKGGAPIKKAIDVAPLVRDCAERALQGTSVPAQFFIADDLWPVGADESQIMQAVHNLISYARASMTANPRLDIHVLNQEVGREPLLLVTPGRYVRISIRDYGAGVETEHLPKIFDPYFGGKPLGNGLELATAYSIVRKHQGQIRVESISGQGTVFHIYLPAAAPEAPSAPMPVRRTRKMTRVARRVLVMDDELPIRELAVQLLDSIGHKTETVADGIEAIDMYQRARKQGTPFDVVIMDLTIPNGMGGKETIRQLRQLDPDVLAIVSSGYSNDPVMAEFRDYGFSGVVPKPYSTEDLAAALDDLFAVASGGSS
jgi:PAS domain S-box-containing protein